MTDQEVLVQIALGTFDIKQANKIARDHQNAKVLRNLTYFLIHHYMFYPTVKIDGEATIIFRRLQDNEATPKDVQQYRKLLY